ncbi:MAG: hypothetical protein Q8R61_09510 [Thiobacillus sp.]|uniref:hypothetical protein n=1 Tax=Thiobacillus sp. TaxID=924 RepID=UPI0027355E33|nr:hypothetical protein [Thiobacillus sp.]MDP3585352.1 hypothetical protein [Thiobacillus sp.]
MHWPRLRFPPGLGGAFWLALLLIGLVELALHSEAVVHKYRAVFALGRAYDKLHSVERNPPQILFVGNSRTDNGIDPGTVSQSWPDQPVRSFNLGLPGANAIVYHGEIMRLNERGLLGREAIHTVVIGIDESALQEDNSLGYVGFLADRAALWESGRYMDWLGSYLRLWSYSANLRQLREPDKLLRFMKASVRELDPVGGAASAHLGYRAGFGAAQNEGQVMRQENAAQQPPSPDVVAFLWRSIDVLQAQDVRVFVTIPPLRDRPSAFVDASPSAAPYRALLARLERRGVIVLPTAEVFVPSDFVNAGHLNDRGAQRYSAELGRQLASGGGR